LTHFSLLDRQNRKSKIIPNRGDFLSQVDSVGSWQLRRVTLLWLPTIAAGILVILHRFTVLRPDAFRCLIPECEGPDSVYGNRMVGSNPADFCKKPVFNDSIVDEDFNCTIIPKSAVAYFEECRPGVNFTNILCSAKVLRPVFFLHLDLRFFTLFAQKYLRKRRW
jgi:hypothetical protein